MGSEPQPVAASQATPRQPVLGLDVARTVVAAGKARGKIAITV